MGIVLFEDNKTFAALFMKSKTFKEALREFLELGEAEGTVYSIFFYRKALFDFELI